MEDGFEVGFGLVLEDGLGEDPEVVVAPLVLVLPDLLKRRRILPRRLTQILPHQLRIERRHTEQEIRNQIKSCEIFRRHVVLFLQTEVPVLDQVQLSIC